MSEYNERLKKAIYESGYRQGWVADQIGVDAAVLSHYISGNREPTEKQKKELAKILNKAQKDLF